MDHPSNSITASFQNDNESSTYNDDKTISKYIKNVRTMNRQTAYAYLRRLNTFKNFILNEHDGLSIDAFLEAIKEGREDPYDVLSGYSAYLSNCNITPITIKYRVITVKNFLEYHDVDITPRKFKLKVKLPKVVRKNKEALSKEVFC